MELTVGKLKEYIKNLPDDSKVFIERIEDFYFENNNWTTKSKDNWDGNKSEWIDAFSVVKYDKDNNLYIGAHY